MVLFKLFKLKLIIDVLFFIRFLGLELNNFKGVIDFGVVLVSLSMVIFVLLNNLFLLKVLFLFKIKIWLIEIFVKVLLFLLLNLIFIFLGLVELK